MLPRLNEMPTTLPLFVDMFAELRARDFEGDLSATSAERVVQATDNVQRFTLAGAAHGAFRGDPVAGIRGGERKTR